MLSRVNLVAILLTLNCVIRAMECTESPRAEERAVAASGKKVLGYATSREDPDFFSAVESVLAGDKAIVPGLSGTHSKTEVQERDRPRKRKRRMDKTMLALLMAYKMKFIALIPTLFGGLILLKATTLLAGFFFALFAAVLGLKIH